MTVAEVNEHIADLKTLESCILKLQNLFMEGNQIKTDNDKPCELTKFIETKAELTSPIRPVMSETACLIRKERERLEKLVNQTIVPGVTI